MRYLRYILVFALMVLGLAKVGAQNDRNFIRQGNRAYHNTEVGCSRNAISQGYLQEPEECAGGLQSGLRPDDAAEGFDGDDTV